MSGIKTEIDVDTRPLKNAVKDATNDVKKMTDEVRRAADVKFNNLEEAAKRIESINRGLPMMMSTAFKGQAAINLRQGVSAGIYKPTYDSLVAGIGNQFGDEHQAQQNLLAMLQHADRIGRNRIDPTQQEPGSGGGLGLMPMARSLLGLFGISLTAGYAANKTHQAGNEDILLADMRRNMGAFGDSVTEFKDKVQKAGDGLGVSIDEIERHLGSYASLSGQVGVDANVSGVQAGVLMARQRGMDPGVGAGLSGRAAWLGVDMKMLTDAMDRSKLGMRQADAAEAILHYQERSVQAIADSGNVQGFKETYLALMRSGDQGLRASAGSMLAGYDESIKHGGNAGDAGKNFIARVLSEHGVTNPFDISEAMERGFWGSATGKKGGPAIGMELIKAMREDYSGLPEADRGRYMRAGMSSLFGGSRIGAGKALDAIDKYEADKQKPGAMEALKKEIDAIENAYKQKSIGDQMRDANKEFEDNLRNIFKEFVAAAVGMKNAMNAMLPHVATIARVMNGGTSGGKTSIEEIKLNMDLGMSAHDAQDPELAAAWKKKYGRSDTDIGGTPDTALRGLFEKYNLQTERSSLEYKRDRVNGEKLEGDYVLRGKFSSSEKEDEFMHALNELKNALNMGISVHVYDSDGNQKNAKQKKGRYPVP